MRLLVLTVAVTTLTAGSAPPEPIETAPSTPAPKVRVVVKTKLVEKRYQGLTAHAWALRANRVRVKYRGARRTLMARPSVGEAINLACATYGYCSTLWRKARCETGGTFSPTAHNPSGASGLFQFLPSTFASTPYARLSVWSPYANAMAAGWMHQQGRGGEWVCE